MSWRESGNGSWTNTKPPRFRQIQQNEEYCLTADLERIKKKFEKEPWFIDIFLTKPNYRFPYLHICVLCKKVYEGFDTTLPVEFVEASRGRLL